MKAPVSWLRDFVDIDIPVVEVARLLTLAGLEVEEIHYVGLEMPAGGDHGFRSGGIAWEREKIVVAEILEVGPHPNADRLTLCRLNDGRQEHTVLTGAPNLFDYKGKGPLPKPLKVAYAKEGATIYDGHADGLALTTLKRAKIRGVESYSMVCSEKELGISDEHEGIIFLDDDAPVGMPLADYFGDAVFEIKINPNMARNPNMLGIAREVAALTRRPLKKPESILETTGETIEGQVQIEISDPALNPRFTLGLIRDVGIKPSPYWVQRRLKLAGMRPINNVVDAANYAMLEIGEPLHAFDYDVLLARAEGRPVVISTRTARPGEKLTTLDGVERTLAETNVLVCDAKGPLSIAGVMGGAESEVNSGTKNILLEAAAWNFINIRKTATQHALPSEASYRFSRGVHPALALEGLKRGLSWMSAWSGGRVAPGLVDEYPQPRRDPLVELAHADVQRALGMDIPTSEIISLLERLEFRCEVRGDVIAVQAPPFRMDVGEGLAGVADIMEEIARTYGYDHIPETLLADPLPPQRGNPSFEQEERTRDLLASLGLDEVVTHRMTSVGRESRLLPGEAGAGLEYVRIANPITPEYAVMRRSLLSSALDVLEHNARLRESLAFFEIGSVYIPNGNDLPGEPRRLAIAITGRRYASSWDTHLEPGLDFYDLKGILEALLEALHIDATYAPAENPAFHPGKCAAVMNGGASLGVFGELHPAVQENYGFAAPVLAADFDFEALLALIPVGYETRPVSEFPPVLEDIAVIVDESIPAERVEALIRQTGGRMLAEVRLFDVYRSDAIGVGKKSLAYNLTYQSFEKTLTDSDAAGLRNKIVRRLQQELGAALRG
ncbi:MAG: phenylalanine--tRNA ligase subunit beta [Chloroflexi bacterium]|nr:phenylalanine--tRNA ligase subunit beta [Chloroflexota bacterium]